jgi:hypothetical protein
MNPAFRPIQIDATTTAAAATNGGDACAHISDRSVQE